MDYNTFWFEDYKILYENDNWKKVIPTNEMTLNDKLNSLMRLSIAMALIQYILTHNTKYIYIPLIVGLVTILIYQNKSLKENMDSNNESKETTMPTKDNPFMNYNIITDERNKGKAMNSYNNEKIQEDIEENFNQDLYRDVGDLYGKSNSQRQFYTMPSTTLPNDQTSFAKWCFNTGPTCKEQSINCTNNYPLN